MRNESYGRFLQGENFVNKTPAVIAVSGATVTRPKEPIIVCMISAATYL